MHSDSPHLVDRMNIKSCRSIIEENDKSLSQKAQNLLNSINEFFDGIDAVNFPKPYIEDIFFSEDFDGYFFYFESHIEPGYSKINIPAVGAYQFVSNTINDANITAESAAEKADWITKKYNLSFFDCSQGCSIELKNSEPTHAIHFIISMSFITGAFNRSGALFSNNYKLGLLAGKEDPVSTHLLAAMATCAKQQELSILGSLVGTFMAHIINYHAEAVESGKSPPPLSNKQLALLEETMLQQIGFGLDLDKIAKALGMNKNQFAKSLKSTTAKTPFQYFNEFRMKKARELIESSEISITNLAMDLGFTDAAHFSKSFNKYWKIPPSKLRSA